ncbi:MAG: aldehyde dehydrogenase family protein, partial [Actinophytocola sp.]|nr:aldehyde dehydrogenase family protein [Actinophytocola sp.]
VEGALQAKMRNMGQSCRAANRFLVARPAVEEFSRRMVERMTALRMGDGLDPSVDVGPLITAAARNRVGRLVEEARERGAQVVEAPGTIAAPLSAERFCPPTVLTEVPAEAAVLAQEVFGPIAPVVAFDSEQQAVDMATRRNTDWPPSSSPAT